MPFEFAERQRVLLEYQADRFQVELCRQVGHRKIFLIELAFRIGFFGVAPEHIVVELAKRIDVPPQIHVHERHQLQETGIHLAQRAGVACRNDTDQILLEPGDRLCRRQLVHCRGAHTAVDRSRHQRQAERCGSMAVLRHDRDRGQGGDAGLADRHDVRTRSQDAQKRDQVLDIFVQAETPVGQRHVAGIVPVGDVDVLIGQHGTHRFAQ